MLITMVEILLKTRYKMCQFFKGSQGYTGGSGGWIMIKVRPSNLFFFSIWRNESLRDYSSPTLPCATHNFIYRKNKPFSFKTNNNKKKLWDLSIWYPVRNVIKIGKSIESEEIFKAVLEFKYRSENIRVGLKFRHLKVHLISIAVCVHTFLA